MASSISNLLAVLFFSVHPAVSSSFGLLPRVSPSCSFGLLPGVSLLLGFCLAFPLMFFWALARSFPLLLGFCPAFPLLLGFCPPSFFRRSCLFLSDGIGSLWTLQT